MKREDFFKQYQTKEWYEKSKRVKARDNNTCQICGRNDVSLNVHHLYYSEGGVCDIEDESLITLCEDCHNQQKEFREETDSLLRQLRTQYTDFEVYLMVRNISDSYFQEGRIDKLKKCAYTASNLLGSLINSNFFRIRVENLIKWRIKVFDNCLDKLKKNIER